MAATALCRAIHAETGLAPEIKWPNDILLGGKKVAGVLTELSAELDRVKHVILGIGVDVNLGAGEFPLELRRRVAAGQFAGVADEWEARCQTIGRNVTIQIGSRRIQGRAESLDGSGELLLRTEHGHLERISGGDVTLEK